jgi:hypothetical protein
VKPVKKNSLKGIFKSNNRAVAAVVVAAKVKTQKAALVAVAKTPLKQFSQKLIDIFNELF